MTTTPDAVSPGRAHIPQGGPPLLAPALAFTALTLACGGLGAAAPHSGSTTGAIAAYDTAHPTLVSLQAMLLFGSSIPLAIWSATVYRRLRRLGVTAPGTAIGLAGGLLAAAALALSGLASWSAGRIADGTAPGAVRALDTLAFAAGAAGFVVPCALLLAGVSVPGLILRLLPRPVAWGGMVIACVGVLATLTLLTSALNPLLPVARFGGVIWLVAVSALLPRTRPRRNPPADSRRVVQHDTTTREAASTTAQEVTP